MKKVYCDECGEFIYNNPNATTEMYENMDIEWYGVDYYHIGIYSSKKAKAQLMTTSEREMSPAPLGTKLPFSYVKKETKCNLPIDEYIGKTLCIKCYDNKTNKHAN